MGLKNQNIFAPSQELPPYALRVSRKARRVILRIAPGKGLEVVLPLGVKDSCVPGVLLRHKEWIERKLAALPKQEAAAVSVVPDMLRLKGGREEVAIRIIDRPGCRCRRDGVEACPAGGRSGLPVPAVERRGPELPAGEPETVWARLKELVRQ